jgi:hypothetical protein
VARPALELADVFRRHGPAYRQQQAPPVAHLRVMRAVETCRTAALGGHVERCPECAFQRIAYNSCRNRHCPKCQAGDKLAWLADRRQELLPISYFHAVFTLPEPLAALALQNKKELFQLLLQTSAETLLTIAADPRHLGAGIGFFSVLHTWGQNLLFHPHVHCVVTGGGLSPDGRQWVASRPDFFLPVRVLSRLFRRLFLDALARRAEHLQFHGDLAPLAAPAAFAAWLARLRRVEWVVYCQPPFGGPEQVVEYLSRYTHRVALSNQRLLALDDTSVTFQYKDYRSAEPQRWRPMTLAGEEFIRRFLLHVLPAGFQRIRYYGLLANRHRARHLAQCRTLLHGAQPALLPDDSQLAPVLPPPTPVPPPCPVCRHRLLVRVSTLPPIRRLPPPPDTS